MEESHLLRLRRVNRFDGLLTVRLGLFLILIPPSFSFAASKSDLAIINAHEHIESIREAPKLLRAMDRLGIQKTVLLGSPSATFDPGASGFGGYEANNEEVLEIARRYPDRFIPFVTLDPSDVGKLEKLKGYLIRGAKGLKLYSGHRIFHDRVLNDESMGEVYSFCEERQIPIVFHINAGYFEEEFRSVLQSHPRLKVVCPHFCLSSIAWQRFERLMKDFPNLYTDLSFGVERYLGPALRRFSRKPQNYQRLVEKFQDRILFGTDAVVTGDPEKTEEWLYEVGRAYRELIEEKEYETLVFGAPERLKGLELSREIQKKVYSLNFYQLVSKKN